MKIVTVLGARPQFVKAATLSRAFKNHPDVREIIVHTGQHYDQNMSDVFFEQMEIPRPDHFLQVTSKHHGEMTGRMLEAVEKVLITEQPDMVLVYGDTNSTLAGALAASKMHIPVAHVEAGLRSFNKKMPEEINRVLTDHVSALLFAPTDSAVTNLQHEGIAGESVIQVGDVMHDAVRYYLARAEQYAPMLDGLGLRDTPFILATIHRAENTNDPERLDYIFAQLTRLAERYPIVLPLHPRTKAILKQSYQHPQFKVIEPVGYFEMLLLQKHCRLVVTDSGGVQKEAFLNNKYCITLREETEWIELVDNHVNYLARPLDTFPELVEQLWSKPFQADGFQPYGDGHAAEKICNVLTAYIKKRTA